MAKFRAYMLPIAIVLGLLLHTPVAPLMVVTPYAIFTILLLNFCAVDIRALKFNRLDFTVMIFQTLASLAVYFGVMALAGNDVVAQGALITILCPVASSVVVVTAALGGNRNITTGYTVYGNLLIAVLAPIYFSFIGEHQDMPFWDSATKIFLKIAPSIALPFFIALFLQMFLPKVKSSIGRFKEYALPIWAFALLVTLGSTIDYIFLYHEGNTANIIWLAVTAVALCALQFGLGKMIGARMNEKIETGQLMGQKNTAIGIWMASAYLIPLASVSLAFYSIAQNLFNSWQMWRDRNRTRTE